MSFFKQEYVQFMSTVLSALTTSGMIWLIGTTNSNSERLARMEERVAHVTDGNYSASDAARDFKATDTKIGALEQRVDRFDNRVMGIIDGLEKRVERLESKELNK